MASFSVAGRSLAVGRSRCDNPTTRTHRPREHTMSLRITSAALALAGLLLAGCSGNKNGGLRGDKYSIAVIPKGLTHEHWQSVHRGAKRAAADLGEQGIAVEVLWEGPRKESDASEQIALIDQKIGRGIHGLVLAPQHSKQMVPPVERAVEEGVPVVILDSNLDRATLEKKPDLIVKYVATDNYNGGRLAARHLVGVLEKGGNKEMNLVLFRYQAGSESTEQREQGFLDT